MPAYFVEHAAVIAVPPARLFPLLAEFRNWPAWSPWLAAEPDARLEFAPDGRSYSWDGQVIGAGSIEQVGTDAPRRLEFLLHFRRPWKSTSSTRFDLTEEDGATRVTWTMSGRLPWFLFFLKPMLTAGVRMDFERGLTRLKDLAEIGAVPSRLEFLGEQAVPGCAWVGLRGSCAIADIASRMEVDFTRMVEEVGRGGLVPTDKPFTQYERWDLARGQAHYLIAFPVAQVPSTLPEGLATGQRPDAKVYTVRHVGPYRHLGTPWAAVMMRQQAKLLRGAKGFPPFECYVSDPCETPENELITDVHFPLA